MNSENVLSAKLEVHELFARYYTAIDSADPEGWVACWADDGVFDSGGKSAQGKEKLRAFIMEHVAMGFKTRHFCTNVFVDIQGDQATASNYMLVRSATDQNAQTATAMCKSKLRKVVGVWKLVEHRYTADPSFDFSKLAPKK